MSLYQRWICCCPTLEPWLLFRCFSRFVLHAGVGDEHAKWSPVATTWYRLLPEVLLLRQPDRQLAHELVQQLPGLLQLVESGRKLRLVVTDVRGHLKLLEKVMRCTHTGCKLTMLDTCFLQSDCRFGTWQVRSGMLPSCSYERSKIISCSTSNLLEPGTRMSCLLMPCSSCIASATKYWKDSNRYKADCLAVVRISA